MKYYDSFKKGNENIFKQMLEVNDMLGGELIDGKILEVVKAKNEVDSPGE